MDLHSDYLNPKLKNLTDILLIVDQEIELPANDALDSTKTVAKAPLLSTDINQADPSIDVVTCIQSQNNETLAPMLESEKVYINILLHTQ